MNKPFRPELVRKSHSQLVSQVGLLDDMVKRLEKQNAVRDAEIKQEQAAYEVKEAAIKQQQDQFIAKDAEIKRLQADSEKLIRLRDAVRNALRKYDED